MIEPTDEERAARVAEKLVSGDDRFTTDALMLEAALMEAKIEYELARDRARLQIASEGL